MSVGIRGEVATSTVDQEGALSTHAVDVPPSVSLSGPGDRHICP